MNHMYVYAMCTNLEMRSIKSGTTIIVIIIGQMLIIVSLLFSQTRRDTISYQGQLEKEALKEGFSNDNKLIHDEIGNAALSQAKLVEILTKAALNNTSTKPYIHISNASSINLDKMRKFQEQEQKMKERVLHIREKCEGYMQYSYWQNLHQGGRVWTYEPEQIHYCIIPKVGCTFWKRIMRFLGKDYPQKKNVQRPSDINRAFVHYGALSNIRQASVQNPIVRMLMTNGKSFMFTRDPYSRLWSAYIDKFLLPDFWRTDALAIVKKLRPNATEYERKCANNVTFQEYLTFINLTYKYGLNEHWDKMHRLCSPCHVQYDIIGKQESFGADADFILTKLNLDYLKENTTKLDMVNEEVTTLTKYNFNLENAIRKGCFEKFDVAKRLWLAFQFNGYIDRETDFPEADLNKTDFLTNPADNFMKYVFQTIEYQTKRGVDIKTQKRTMMLEAYKNIPKDLLKGIANVYEYDFELFEYKKDLFS